MWHPKGSHFLLAERKGCQDSPASDGVGRVWQRWNPEDQGVKEVRGDINFSDSPSNPWCP